MIKAEQIPDEVVEALKDAANQWAMWLTDEEVRAALAAGLAAWPRRFHASETEHLLVARQAIILPLKENTDGK
jgi:hypothetical protein